VLGGTTLVVAAGLFALRPRPAEGPVNAAAPAGTTLRFDGDRAYADLSKQVEFGPRVPSTAGHKKCRQFLVDTLTPLADKVERQDFSDYIRGSKLEMSNVIARWNGSGGADASGVLLAAHWDTRPTADYEQDPDNRKKPIPGANDGASGAAVLLELARMFKSAPPPVPVMVVFFDGEDYGPGIDLMFLGSKYFASHLPQRTPKRGVLIDMIGDRDLVIPREGHSQDVAPDVVDEIYSIAQRRGYEKQFPQRDGGPIEDDHIPLHRKGLKVIDLIDFDYGPGHSWWHTLADTPDKCSPASLKAVGEVLLEWTYTRK
jgi:Zn-dependent M28 family amino/carboxypeptidase